MGSVVHAADVVVPGANIVVEDRHVSLALPDSWGIMGAGVVVDGDVDGTQAMTVAIYTGPEDDEVVRMTVVRTHDGSMQLISPFAEPIWLSGPMATMIPDEED
jgi:hypothetical protein